MAINEIWNCPKLDVIAFSNPRIMLVALELVETSSWLVLLLDYLEPRVFLTASAVPWAMLAAPDAVPCAMFAVPDATPCARSVTPDAAPCAKLEAPDAAHCIMLAAPAAAPCAMFTAPCPMFLACESVFHIQNTIKVFSTIR